MEEKAPKEKAPKVKPIVSLAAFDHNQFYTLVGTGKHHALPKGFEFVECGETCEALVKSGRAQLK